MTVAYVGRPGAKLRDGSVRRRSVDWGDRGQSRWDWLGDLEIYGIWRRWERARGGKG